MGQTLGTAAAAPAQPVTEIFLELQEPEDTHRESNTALTLLHCWRPDVLPGEFAAVMGMPGAIVGQLDLGEWSSFGRPLFVDSHQVAVQPRTGHVVVLSSDFLHVHLNTVPVRRLVRWLGVCALAEVAFAPDGQSFIVATRSNHCLDEARLLRVELPGGEWPEALEYKVIAGALEAHVAVDGDEHTAKFGYASPFTLPHGVEGIAFVADENAIRRVRWCSEGSAEVTTLGCLADSTEVLRVLAVQRGPAEYELILGLVDRTAVRMRVLEDSTLGESAAYRGFPLALTPDGRVVAQRPDGALVIDEDVVMMQSAPYVASCAVTEDTVVLLSGQEVFASQLPK